MRSVDRQRPRLYHSPYDREHRLLFSPDRSIMATVIATEVVRRKQWLFVLLENNIDIGWLPAGWTQEPT